MRTFSREIEENLDSWGRRADVSNGAVPTIVYAAAAEEGIFVCVSGLRAHYTRA